jgi:hypothetical protein
MVQAAHSETDLVIVRDSSKQRAWNSVCKGLDLDRIGAETTESTSRSMEGR